MQYGGLRGTCVPLKTQLREFLLKSSRVSADLVLWRLIKIPRFRYNKSNGDLAVHFSRGDAIVAKVRSDRMLCSH